MFQRIRHRRSDRPADHRGNAEWTSLDALLSGEPPRGSGLPLPPRRRRQTAGPDQPDHRRPTRSEPARSAPSTQAAPSEDDVETWDQALEYAERLVGRLVTEGVETADRIRAAALRTAADDAAARALDHVNAETARADRLVASARARARAELERSTEPVARLRESAGVVGERLLTDLAGLRARHDELDDLLHGVRRKRAPGGADR